MNQQFKTMARIAAIVTVAISFTGIFAVLSLVLMALSVQKAFELFFSVGWWAALLTMFVPLVVYVIALVSALHYIERKTA